MDILLQKVVSTTERNGIWGRVKIIFIFVIIHFLLLECLMSLFYFIGIKIFPKGLPFLGGGREGEMGGGICKCGTGKRGRRVAEIKM